jgi:hypothetical protein
MRRLEHTAHAGLQHAVHSLAGRPSGPVYTAAHALWRNLQRQVMERGWRCSSPKSPIPAAAAAAAADEAGGAVVDPGDGTPRSSSSSPLGGRRYFTMQEQTRQRLEAAGAKKYEDWAAEKQRAEQLERQRVAVSGTHAGWLAATGCGYWLDPYHVCSVPICASLVNHRMS